VRERALRRAVAEEGCARERYLESIARLSAEQWSRPRREGQWSPAEITEHLALAYEVLARELRSGEGMAMRLPSWRMRLLRWFLLPHILFHRSFPLRAPAPRELRPRQAADSAQEGAERLRRAAATFAAALGEPGRGRLLTHAYFGRLPVERVLRFAAVHLDHHRAQVEAAGSGDERR
jgi:uncharacterized damage-inducible protein DinB